MISKILSRLKHLCFIILFSWISFFPQAIICQYKVYTRIFLFGFLVILLANKKYVKHLFSIQDWPLWVFLICLAAGMVFATDKYLAKETYLYLVITFPPLFYIGKALCSFDKNRNIIIGVICICSCLVAFIGLLELFFGKNILYENFIANPYYERYIRFNPRPMSTQFNPVVLGSYLLGCLPFSFYLFRNKSLRLRLLGISLSTLSIFVIVLTFSRGVFLGLIALLLFYLWKRHKRRIAALILFCFFLFMLICSCQKDAGLNRFGFHGMIKGGYASIFSEYRINRVVMTFRTFNDYPLFGIGFNHFRLRFHEYCDKEDVNKIPYEFMIPDNMYLTFLAETGIVGTTGFFLFLFLLFKRGLKQLNTLKDENKKQMLLIAMSALVGLLVNMGAYELFYWHHPYMLFCLVCGFIQGSVRLNHKAIVITNK